MAIMVANAPAAMAPFGAKDPVFGTNPIAFAAPRPGKDPLVVDLSLSRVARGKVMNARKAGKDIPEEWALDKDGNPTTKCRGRTRRHDAADWRGQGHGAGADG